ncbi:hypothetical protein [Novosphingobium panipatense]|uniref:Uncharacterized protein n=1 Tax=Novosphingobium panipatense TaxID=428991 RepID=A0ABY1QHU9_9SPHN|nr:hypothetical protein [Novosphingobium panipatense]SMP71959.1 hypothetical protein SAMN06296065_10688 [Novosphingobium panipatense]
MHLWPKMLLGTSCAAVLGLVASSLVPTRMTGLDESPLDAYGITLALTGTEADAAPEPVIDADVASGPPYWLFGANAKAEEADYASFDEQLAFSDEENPLRPATHMIGNRPVEMVAEAAEDAAADVQQAEFAEPAVIGPAVLVTAPVQKPPVIILTPPPTIR